MKLLFLGTWEIIVIVLVILLLFGAKRIPELMHGMGKGVKSFKDGMNGVDSSEPQQKSDARQNIETSQNDNTSAPQE